jgi:hypothetical protein
MTRYYINEREIAPPLDMSSFDEILKHAEDCHLPPNSVIRQITIDGNPIISDSFSEPGEIFKQLENREKIEIFTGTVTEIAHESIIEALAYLDRIESITPSVASSFQIYPGPEAFENLRQLLDGFYWMSILLDKLVSNFNIVLDACSVQGISVRDHFDKFISVLKQLIDSQQRGDFVLISDLLEYEVLPIVPVWKDIFNLFSQKVAVAQ